MSTEKQTNSVTPVWVTKNGIHQIAFVEEYLKMHPMRYINGRFYTVDGIVGDEEAIHADIFRTIMPYLARNVSRETDALMKCLRSMARSEMPAIDMERIHFRNGTYFLTGTFPFTEEKDFCINRLPVDYVPDAPEPEVWLAFLRELLEEDDIPVLQEYMGYCLLPTTRGQKMLMIIGEGGEGKSRVGRVMRALLGDNMNVGSIQKLEKSPFARADLVHKLLLVDDDMQMEALPSTNIIKSMITAEEFMDVEQKGKQSVQAPLYCRFLGFGNGSLNALHDRSMGFYRRQIILKAKPKPSDRVDNPYIIDGILEEKEGILIWCLIGLHRLRARHYHFSESRASRRNLIAAMKESNNVLEFMRSEAVEYNPDYSVTAKTLYFAYEKWCDANAATAFSSRTFISFLRERQARYGIAYSTHISNGNGMVRGFTGIRVK